MVDTRLSRRIKIAAVVAACGSLGAAAWLHFVGPSSTAIDTAGVAADPGQAPVNTPPAPASASVPGIQHPIEARDSAAPALGAAGIPGELMAVFGRDAVLTLFQIDDFPRRLVATVDNLGRHFAPTGVWPLNPAPGRFAVEHRNRVDLISPGNAQRYAAYLRLLDTVDPRQVVDLYIRCYPALQAAYEGIGYPKGYFNDRLVEVLDQLLATPELSAPAIVWLADIDGPEQPQRPWVLYRFEDPALESLTAGQKILLRFGPVEERVLKAKLAQYRQLLTARQN